jgi:NADH-quinone oxidoreductase subunit K
MLLYDILLIIVTIFLISVFGVFINKQNILLIIISFEISLLAINLNFLLISLFLDDLLGQLAVLFILVIAACESSIGLSLLISYYRITGSISTLLATTLHG